MTIFVFESVVVGAQVKLLAPNLGQAKDWLISKTGVEGWVCTKKYPAAAEKSHGIKIVSSKDTVT